jgi:putative glycosyltransferase (TIGR04348 family)
VSYPSVVIVSPALAQANNGNWRTAQRWQQMLESTHAVRIVDAWPDGAAAGDRCMLALHARRSARSIDAWSQAHPRRGLAVVLTGTDLYEDIHHDRQAQRSLAQAQRLVVLQDRGVDALPAKYRPKARVIYQSTSARALLSKPREWLRAVMVGHLRPVKAPQTVYQAAALLQGRCDIRIDHIGNDGNDGDAVDAELARQARATALAHPHYRRLGALPHPQARRRIQRAHVLVHPSVMEGGAHVIMEAVRSGTPVLASDAPGNVGMLGADYEGYFPVGDAAALARLLERCRASQEVQDPAQGLLARLRAQCEARAPCFEPAFERAALLQLLHELEPTP